MPAFAAVPAQANALKTLLGLGFACQNWLPSAWCFAPFLYVPAYSKRKISQMRALLLLCSVLLVSSRTVATVAKDVKKLQIGVKVSIVRLHSSTLC